MISNNHLLKPAMNGTPIKMSLTNVGLTKQTLQAITVFIWHN